MYFLIVLLLLFETEFTCSMRRRGKQPVEENTMVPLEIAYTNSVQTFIQNTIVGASHLLTSIPLTLSNLADEITGNLFYDKCDVELDPKKPGKFRATRQSKRVCQEKCSHTNTRYDVGTCVKREELIFLCNCTTKYKIWVSQSLKKAVENAVSGQTAPLFLAYVAETTWLELGKVEIPNTSELDSENTEVSTSVLHEGGLIENKGPILINEDEMFQRLLQKMNQEECDLRRFGFMYLSYVNPIVILIYIVLLIYFSFESVH